MSAPVAVLLFVGGLALTVPSSIVLARELDLRQHVRQMHAGHEQQHAGSRLLLLHAHLRSDEPLNLYSTPVGILRRAMGRSEGNTSLELALRSSLGASYDVSVRDMPEGVVVTLKRRGVAPHPA